MSLHVTVLYVQTGCSPIQGCHSESLTQKALYRGTAWGFLAQPSIYHSQKSRCITSICFCSLVSGRSAHKIDLNQTLGEELVTLLLLLLLIRFVTSNIGFGGLLILWFLFLFCFFLIVQARQYKSRMTSNSQQSTCFSTPSTRITGMNHHARLWVGGCFDVSDLGFMRQDLCLQFRLAQTSSSACCSLTGAGMTCMCHHTKENFAQQHLGGPPHTSCFLTHARRACLSQGSLYPRLFFLTFFSFLFLRQGLTLQVLLSQNSLC